MERENGDAQWALLCETRSAHSGVHVNVSQMTRAFQKSLPIILINNQSAMRYGLDVRIPAIRDYLQEKADLRRVGNDFITIDPPELDDLKVLANGTND